MRIVRNSVDFNCAFADKVVNYRFSAPDEKIAGQLGTVSKDNIGRDLFSVGIIEIPEV